MPNKKETQANDSKKNMLIEVLRVVKSLQLDGRELVYPCRDLVEQYASKKRIELVEAWQELQAIAENNPKLPGVGLAEATLTTVPVYLLAAEFWPDKSIMPVIDKTLKEAVLLGYLAESETTDLPAISYRRGDGAIIDVYREYNRRVEPAIEMVSFALRCAEEDWPGQRIGQSVPVNDVKKITAYAVTTDGLRLLVSDRADCPADGRTEKTEPAPTKEAMEAWRLQTILGINKQTEIAETMSKERGRKIHQGQVSKWIRQVKSYLRAGNTLPDLPRLDREPQSLDPEIIEFGERTNRRTVRQRPRRSDD